MSLTFNVTFMTIINFLLLFIIISIIEIKNNWMSLKSQNNIKLGN